MKQRKQKVMFIAVVAGLSILFCSAAVWDDSLRTTERVIELSKSKAEKKGYTKVILEYDEFGNVKTASFYGDDNKLVLLKEGFAKVVFTYNTNGDRIVAEEFFGVDGKTRVLYGEDVRSYDGDTVVRYRDEYSMMTQQYNEHGHLTEQAFFGVNNEPILLVEGFAKVTWVYDEFDRVKEHAFFGVNDEPVLHTNRYKRMDPGMSFVFFTGGHWKVEIEYNDLASHSDKVTYFGLDGKPILQESGSWKAFGPEGRDGRLLGPTGMYYNQRTSYIIKLDGLE